MLTQQVDAVANKDYAKAHDLAYTAYQDMFGLAKQLSDGVRGDGGGQASRTAAPRPAQAAWRAHRGRDEVAVGRTRGAGRDRRGVLGDRRGRPRRGPPAAPPRRLRLRRVVPVGAQLRRRDVAEPVRLRIPALGVDSPLLHLGLATDRSIEVPRDYGTAGWFSGGPRPGQPGPAVILGHVDSKAGPGVFYRLAELPVGRGRARGPGPTAARSPSG